MIVEPDLEELFARKNNRLHFKQIHMNEDKEVKTDNIVLTKKFPARTNNTALVHSKKANESISFSKYK
jgi:hypothetical protein